MEEEETLNGSIEFDIADNHYLDIATTASIKGSFVSQPSSSSSKESREKVLNVISSNLNKKGLIQEEGFSITSLESLPFENSNKKGNFNLKYFEIQQWPELSSSQEFKSSLRIEYKGLKSKYIFSQIEKSSLLEKLREIENTQCEVCPLLEKELYSNRQALEEAIELSKMMLNEVRKISSSSFKNGFNK